ncbi:hypothetical protein RN347_05990 [Halomonas sp. PAMB 3264]|uniref:hypothetical protein n=1 Tax=Halomonas sp. PAMB 3264 TaxID=3075222 RepID=UPI00289E53B5|nr:hypothetical protein [Halomonas sp. PAMB 3264]WNL43452.1 hypothetical protein RN347_05990 [Halomonas sp. PAMB 3264]
MSSALKPIGLLLVLFSSVLLVQLANGPVLGSDDEMYAAVAQSGDIIGWLIERYAVWSSRSLIDLATILLVTHENLWMLLNAVVITGMSLAVSILANPRGEICFTRSALALACFWLIPASTMYYSVWWLTGAMNYLWPVAASLMYWAVVKYEAVTSRTRVWLLVAGLSLLLFSAFSEQMMVVNFIVHGFLLCRLKRAYFKNRAALIGVFINTIGFLFFILGEGNTARMLLSIDMYFPEFAHMGVVEKAYFGISLGLYQFFYMGSWISILLCLAIVLRGETRLARYIAAAAAFFIMLTSGYLLGYTGSAFSRLIENVGFIENIYPIEYPQAYTSAFYLAMVLGTVFAVGLAFALLGDLRPLTRQGWSALLESAHVNRALLLVLSFIPACMLGFSPTMYVSRERILFASTAIVLLLVVMMVGKTRYSWHFLAAMTVVALFTYWHPAMPGA